MRRPFLALGPLAVPLFAYGTAVVISGIGRPTVEFGPLTFKEIFASLETLRPFLVYFWAYDVFKNFPQFRTPVVLSMLISSGLSGLLATFQQLFNWHPWSTAFLQGTGFLSEPMAYSGIMQIFSLIALGLWITGGFHRFAKPFNGCVLFSLIATANIFGLIFASERGAWLGFGVAVIVSTALVSRPVMLRTVFALASSMLAAWFFLPVVKQRLMPMFDGHIDAGITARWQIWRVAYKEFLQSPWTGIGSTRFPHLQVEGATGLGKQYLAHAHSNLLQILATTGIVGLCSYLFIVLSSLVIAAQHFHRNTPYSQQFASRKERNERGIALGLMSAVLSLTIAGLVEYNFGTGQVRLALWFVLALLSSDI